MKKGINLRAFPPAMKMRECLSLAKRAGFQAVEINLEPDREYTLNTSLKRLGELGRMVADLGLEISSLYSREEWSYSISSSDIKKRKKGIWIIKRLMEIAAILKVDSILVVPGAVDNSLFAKEPEILAYDLVYERSQETLKLLVEEAQNYGVSLLIENVWNKFLLSPLEMKQFVDSIGSDYVGVYFDVGNIMLYGYPEQWIRILNRRIGRVHLKDFRLDIGNIRGFTYLLQGDVNWWEVIRALKEIGYDAYLVAEVMPPYRHSPERLIYETSASMDAILSLA